MKKESLIFGVYPVIEAIRSDKPLDKIYIQKGLQHHELTSALEELQDGSVTINEVPVEKLDRMIRSNHQGVVATISPITFPDFETTVESILSNEKEPLFLVLDQLSDVRNFGAIIRTAECTGVHAIIIQKKGGAAVSGDTVKASAGAIFNVPICKVDHIKDAMYYFQGSGVRVIAATEKATQNIYDTDLRGPLAIVMGSEGKGISPSVLKIAQEEAALPLLGNINSLNVSVACGAFLYEVTRQRLGD